MATFAKTPQSTNLHLDQGLWYNRRERARSLAHEGDRVLTADRNAKEKQE
jgi:hypothetical protein